jgi:hypothetical protein
VEGNAKLLFGEGVRRSRWVVHCFSVLLFRRFGGVGLYWGFLQFFFFSAFPFPLLCSRSCYCYLYVNIIMVYSGSFWALTDDVDG